MVSSKAASRLVSLSVLFTTARAQINPDFTRSSLSPATSSSSTPASSTSASTTSSPTSISSSSTTADRASFTTAIVPLYLYKAVESFLDDFPTTRPNYFTAQSWPSTLVIGTATYGLQTKAVTKASTQSSQSATATDGSQRASTTKSQSNGQNKDKRLGIILGVILGFVALALMGVLFWFLARRKKKAGSFFMRRSSPSTSSSHSRRLAGLGTVSQAVSRPAKGRTMSKTQCGESALFRPPLLHHQSSRSTTNDMPFHTPMEGPDDKPNQQALDDQRAELARIIRDKSTQRQSSSTAKEIGRPPPFSPESLHQARPPPPPNRNHESDHIVSPISPSKSSERESTSIVHYPSMDEVNDFDFAGDGQKRASMGGQKGWHPARQRIEGRYEMA